MPTPQDITLRLKRLLAELDAVGLDALESLEQGQLGLKDQVEIGQVLWRCSAVVADTLTPIKDSLRREGLSRSRGQPGPQFISGRHRDARCTVTVPAPTVFLRPEVDMHALRAKLGTAFETFFQTQEQVLPTRDFQEQAAKSPHLALLASVVDTKNDPPRVSFYD